MEETLGLSEYFSLKTLSIPSEVSTPRREFSSHTIAIMIKISAAIFCLALFICLTFSVTSAGGVQSFDESILKWIETIRAPFMNSMMLDVTALGGLALTVVLGLLAVAVFLLADDSAAALYLTLTSAGGFYI